MSRFPRRNSWDGGISAEPPETTTNDQFRPRRSLAHIFSSFGKGGKQTLIDRKGRMTSSDKPKRKGNDRTSKTKSQFYVDLTEGNIQDSSSSANKGGDQEVAKNTCQPNTCDNLVSPEGVDITKDRSQSVPTDLTNSSTTFEDEIKVERKSSDTLGDCSSTRKEQQQRNTQAFSRGSVGRLSKSHTQLGVLVIPNSFCESKRYKERALSSRGTPAAKKMGSDYSKVGVEDEDEEEEEEEEDASTSSSVSSSEVGGGPLSPVAQQQYSSVVSQLCDYLYSTPILPSTHHPYHHTYASNNNNNTKKPAIKPKPKVIPPPVKSKVTKSIESERLPPQAQCNGRVPGQSATGIIGTNGTLGGRSESGDSPGNDRDQPRGLTKGSMAQTNEMSPPNRSENGTSEIIDSVDSDIVPVIEPEQMCKTVSNSALKAEGIQRTNLNETVDFMVLHKTNIVCDIESQILTCESLTTTTKATSSNSNNSSMSDPVSCDTNNPVTSTTITPELTPKPSPDLNSTEKRDQKIFLIAKELMSSERVFVDVLRLLNVDFRNFIFDNMAENITRISSHVNNNNNNKVNKNLMQEEDVHKILNFLPQLQNLNEEILLDLEGRITDWERHRKISDVIVRKGPFLKLYSAYIKEFQSQCEHLEECCHRYPHFAKAVKDFESTERCAKLSIKHYMLKPVQRIPQYRLLLEDYLKKLPDDGVDYVDTQTALAVVSNVASHANDTMKQGTNFVKLLALQDRLSRIQNNNDTIGVNNHQITNTAAPTNTHYELIRPGRSFLKEGELLKLCRRAMQPRYYILLSDVLLYTSFITSGPGGALRVNYELPLEGMRVETPKAEDFKNEFSVISTSRSFTLQAKSAEERDEWIQALREAIEDNASRRSTFLRAKIPSFQHPNTSSLGKQAPVWIPDDRVTMCQQCTAEFTLTFRRHHCRACGKVVCDHCSANRAPLQYKRNQSLRVCDTCFEVLQKDFECRYEGTVTVEEESKLRRVSSLKAQFKRGIKENRSHYRKKVPDRLLEVSASDAASQMCGYLRVMVRRSLRRGWFVLKDRVLYEYRAPQDVCALQSLPVLGYQVKETDKVRDVADGLDNCLTFQLTHPNRPPIIFHADSPHLAEKWIQAMKEAVVLT